MKNEENAKEMDIIINEIDLAKKVIKEITNPLDLLRELISNSCAKEVEATKIEIVVYLDPNIGQVFKVIDNGKGMDYTGDKANMRRLDRFLNFGFSGSAGLPNDEFGYHGLGSKIAYRSTQLIIETVYRENKTRSYVILDEPWKTIEKLGKVPKPKYQDHKECDEPSGTTIEVKGFLVANKKNYSFEDLEDYICHRTFVGFTKKRDNPPQIVLKTGVNSNIINIGFSVFKKISEAGFNLEQINNFQTADNGTTVFVNLNINKNLNGKNYGITLHVKGVYTMPENNEKYGLNSKLGRGLIVSVKGIPYFKLDFGDFCDGGIYTSPGEKNLCLVCECDELSENMNIARDGCTADAEGIVELFYETLKDQINKINNSQEYIKFKNIWREVVEVTSAEGIEKTMAGLQQDEYGWIYFKDNRDVPLHIIPRTELDTLAILWKLEGSGKLTKIFKKFITLAATGGRGTDLVVGFKETDKDPSKHIPIEVKLNLKSKMNHSPKQTPIIICWDLGSKKIKYQDEIVDIQSSNLRYKYTAIIQGTPLTIYVLKEMIDIIEISK